MPLVNNENLKSDDETTLPQLPVIDSEVILKFPSSNKKGLGKTTLTSHIINVGSATPIKQRYYPVLPKFQADMYAEIDRMYGLGATETITLNMKVIVSRW